MPEQYKMRAEELPPFRSVEDCAKCGQVAGNEQRPNFEAAWNPRYIHYPYHETVDLGTEFMTITCSRCGYSWRERCADYKAEKE